jgi:hypothetical protein
MIDLDTTATGIAEGRIHEPAGFNLTAYPNPFNPSTRIGFYLAQGGQVDLNIYDLRGRMVRSLLSGPVTAGEHSLVWDGCDKDERNLAAGVYIVGIQAAGIREVAKLVLLK